MNAVFCSILHDSSRPRVTPLDVIVRPWMATGKEHLDHIWVPEQPSPIIFYRVRPSSTSETRAINFHITCETKNLIYMIQCNRCHLQYIGETKRRLKDRFNEHRRTFDNAYNKSKPTTVAEHFLSSPHNISKDMQLIPIEKIFSNRDSIRKAREAFLYISVYYFE